MDKIGAVIKREFLTKVKSKYFVIGTVLGPVFMIAIVLIPVILATMQTDEAKTIGIVDKTGMFSTPLRMALDDTLSSGVRASRRAILSTRFQETSTPRKSTPSAFSANAIRNSPRPKPRSTTRGRAPAPGPNTSRPRSSNVSSETRQSGPGMSVLILRGIAYQPARPHTRADATSQRGTGGRRGWISRR